MNALALIALHKRLRSLIARGAHRSELLETCDLVDVAMEAPAPEALPLASPPAAEPARSPAQEPADPAVEGREVACSPLEQLLGKWPGDETDEQLSEAMRAFELPSTPRNMPLATLRREPWERAPAPALDRDHLLAAARAARESALALDTLATHLRRLADSAPPAPEMPAALPATQPAPESTHQASEATGGAELSLPAGWRSHGDYDGTVWYGDYSTWVAPSRGSGRDGEWFTRGLRYAPTMLQAMCAALGIRLSVGYGKHIARLQDGAALASGPTADDCARAALEAFHARQQAATARPDDACKCAYRNGGHRVVSRFCDLHGAAWQTLAEQRAGDVQGSPELEPSERGLR